ncbi:unnamed protein product [Caenorhabditis nigoni]
MEESMSKIPEYDDEEKKFKEKSIVLSNCNKKELKTAKRFVLKYMFENVPSFKKGGPYPSEIVEHFNLKWCMEIKRFQNDLDLCVFCDPIDPITDKWSIDTKLEYRMMRYDGYNATNSVKCSFEIKDAWMTFDLTDWTEYLIDDNLTVEVDIEILEMTGFEREKMRLFDESQKEVSDVILVVQNTKFYVSKMYLAAQSTFFKALLLGNFSESMQSEIALSEIEPEDFQYFLEVLYGEPAIDDTTVECVARLADMYDAQTALRRCEEFLLEKSEKSLKNKLQLATRYHMEKLKQKCMGEIKTVDDMRSVIPMNYDDFDHQTTFELLKKLISFH